MTHNSYFFYKFANCNNVLKWIVFVFLVWVAGVVVIATT